ncbi:hypothetical protein GGR51DRAFT_492280 [Nemania sp. FL0031]|nr:hypothetical protein GGR51DRAFT_492280 [Nemania sp. FL0031]
MESTSGTPGLVVPVSGAALFASEVRRRRGLWRRGALATGCAEIDDVLLVGGGFERGCVVGVSAEEVDFGVLIGLQTIARALVFGDSRGRAAIITTLPVTAILPTLRDVIRSQAQVKLGAGNPGVDAEVRRSLEAISISRIFDIEGLWEVLRELGQTRIDTSSHHNAEKDQDIDPKAENTTTPSPNEKREDAIEAEAEAEVIETTSTDHNSRGPSSSEPTVLLSRPVTQPPPLRIGPELRQPVRKTEILDSDEEPLSSSPLSSPPSTLGPDPLSPIEDPPQLPAEQEQELHDSPSPPPGPGLKAEPQEPEVLPSPSPSPPPSPQNLPPPVPDIILVTHFSSLLTALFTHSDKTSAHTNLQLLSSYLRHLAQSSGPLIMLLNTTTSSSPFLSTSTSTAQHNTGPHNPIPPPPPPPDPDGSRQHKPLDATLRSIFNPIPNPNPRGPGIHVHPYSTGVVGAARRNKPSFGATFAQFLDLHLLCTALPRTRDDAETAIALGPGAGDVKRGWVVEVLMDEMGVWGWGEEEEGGSRREGEGGEDGTRPPARTNREQRWAAVDVRDGVMVVNAFTAGGGGGGGGGRMAGGRVSRGPVRVAAGFGGPRV